MFPLIPLASTKALSAGPCKRRPEFVRFVFAAHQFYFLRLATSIFAIRFGESETDQSRNEFDSCIAGIRSESY